MTNPKAIAWLSQADTANGHSAASRADRLSVNEVAAMPGCEDQA